MTGDSDCNSTVLSHNIPRNKSKKKTRIRFTRITTFREVHQKKKQFPTCSEANQHSLDSGDAHLQNPTPLSTEKRVDSLIGYYREKVVGRPNCPYKQLRVDLSNGISPSALHPSNWHAMTLYSCSVMVMEIRAGRCDDGLILTCEPVDQIDTSLLERRDNLNIHQSLETSYKSSRTHLEGHKTKYNYPSIRKQSEQMHELPL